MDAKIAARETRQFTGRAVGFPAEHTEYGRDNLPSRPPIPRLAGAVPTMRQCKTCRELTDDEQAAIEAFAKAHGRKWRDELSQVYWYNARIWEGPIAGMGNLLHGVRNEFGPTWLYDVYKPRKHS